MTSTFLRPDPIGATPRPALTPRTSPGTPPDTAHPVIEAKQFKFYYGAAETLRGIDLPIAPRSVTAIIGPSGCGKSTFLRSINRLNDLIPGTRYEGELLFDGELHTGPVDGSGAAPVAHRHGGSRGRTCS
jgi:ABC-type multidrug transport system fused ATPase/permease subunit